MQFIKKLLKKAISKWTKEHKQLIKDYEIEKVNISGVLSRLDYYIVNTVIRRNEENYVKASIEHHERKLNYLTNSANLPFKSKEVIKNLSSYELTTEEADTLNKKWTMRYPHLNYIKQTFFTPLKLFHNS